MPIYEYLCKNCGSLTEVMQKISDPAPTACDNCHKGPLEKQMSMTSFALKGTGWYVTDFKGNSDKKPSATPSPSSSTGTTDPAKPVTASPDPAPAASSTPAPASDPK
jgi:putative FmdB family regulatory protein